MAKSFGAGLAEDKKVVGGQRKKNGGLLLLREERRIALGKCGLGRTLAAKMD